MHNKNMHIGSQGRLKWDALNWDTCFTPLIRLRNTLRLQNGGFFTLRDTRAAFGFKFNHFFHRKKLLNDNFDSN